MKDFITLDFETAAIHRRPQYPPVPCGLATQFPGQRKGRYFAWGHASKNDATWGEGHLALERAWESGLPLLGHHMKFDYDVAETKMQMRELPWERLHDTEYLLFLSDPHAISLSLKPSAERILGMLPEERDNVRDWLVSHKVVKKNQKAWGAYISQAPGELVAPYAVGDVTRTKALFLKLYEEIKERGMLQAYDTERQLMKVFLKCERGGMRVDLLALESDYRMYVDARDTADRWLRQALHAPELNLDADQELADVLDREGIVENWVWTAGGKFNPKFPERKIRHPQRSVSKKNLTIDQFTNETIALVYAYRVRLSTCLSMFMTSWLDMARESNGMIYTNINQVRQQHGKEKVGTRTGRPSSNPNFYNIPKDFEDKDDGYKHPGYALRIGRTAEFTLPPLPQIRNYLLPDKDCLWLHRDYNQQELRMLAHFENGRLCAQYNAQPRLDIHTVMQDELHSMGFDLTRAGVKILNFSDVYGKGLTGLAESLHTDQETAQRIKNAKTHLMPGVNALTREVKQRGADGKPIRTWDGREYYAEIPRYVEKFKRVLDFNYKLLNYLIQGSSAGVTKNAINRYDEDPKRESRFLVTVYDEMNSSSPSLKGLSEKAKRDIIQREMKILRNAMESVSRYGPDGKEDSRVMVPMLTDGKLGERWGSLTGYDKPATLEAACVC